jgi:hypothetical protein
MLTLNYQHLMSNLLMNFLLISNLLMSNLLIKIRSNLQLMKKSSVMRNLLKPKMKLIGKMRESLN